MVIELVALVKVSLSHLQDPWLKPLYCPGLSWRIFSAIHEFKSIRRLKSIQAFILAAWWYCVCACFGVCLCVLCVIVYVPVPCACAQCWWAGKSPNAASRPTFIHTYYGWPTVCCHGFPNTCLWLKLCIALRIMRTPTRSVDDAPSSSGNIWTATWVWRCSRWTHPGSTPSCGAVGFPPSLLMHLSVCSRSLTPFGWW